MGYTVYSIVWYIRVLNNTTVCIVNKSVHTFFVPLEGAAQVLES